MSIKAAIGQLIEGRDLSSDEAEAAMRAIMAGEATPAQIGSYLTALRIKGETATEIAGSVRAMRAHLVRVDLPGVNGVLVDTCGTGGDGQHTFNISTTAAFVVAACGVKVAKHGNRAASSRSGSADLLMALGGNVDLRPAQVARSIEETNIGFLYAIHHHPAMKHAIGPRREIGQRTIFNILGPLTNPAGATHQLIGVYDAGLTEPIAHVLQELGSQAALIVHSADGLDELSTSSVNRVSRLWQGKVESFELDPAELDLPRAGREAFRGGSPEENAQITREILSGQDRGPRRDIVLLNAAAALSLENNDWAGSLAQARQAIESGAAWQTLQAWIEATQRMGQP